MKQSILQKKINLQITLSFGKMKIDKEKFNSLKQMDRIEYRQKLNEIKESFDGMEIFSFVRFSMIMMGFILLLAFSSYNISKELFVIFFNILYPLGKILLIGGLMILFIDILLIFVNNKKINELNEEYFSVEVKK